MLNKYLKFILLLLYGEFSVRIISFATNIYLTNKLLPENFGLITVGVSFMSAALIFSDIGISTLGFLESAKKEKMFNLYEIFVVKVLYSFLTFGIASTVAFFTFKENHLQFVIVLTYLFIIIVRSTVTEWYMKGTQNFKLYSFIKFLESSCFLLFTVIFVTKKSDVFKIPILYIVSMIPSATLATWNFISSVNFKNYSIKISTMITVMKHSITLGLASFLNQIPIFLPPILISKFSQIREAGLYGAAWRLVVAVMFVDRILTTIFLSEFPKKWQENKTLAKREILIVFKFVMIVGIFISMLLSSLSGIIISKVYDSSFINSVKYMKILSWFIAPTMFNSVLVYTMIATDNKKHYLRSALYATGLSFILFSFFSIQGNSTGFAFSLIITETIFSLFFIVEFRRIIGSANILSIVKISLTSIILIAVSRHSPLLVNLTKHKILDPILFIFIIPFLKIFSLQETEYILNKIKKVRKR